MIIEVNELNELLGQGFSFRQICQTKSLKRSTVQSQLKKSGYELKNNQYVLVSEINVQESGRQKVPMVGTKEITLEDRIDFIKQSLSGIVHNFVSVACELNYIHSNNLFQEKGFNNIVDFASNEFGLDRTKTYSFLKLYDRCIDSSNNLLKEEYSKFNYSQLVEILYLPERVEKEVTPDMTVKQIREKKKQVKEIKQHEEVQQPLEGQQTFIEAEFKQINEVAQDEERDYKKEFEALKGVFEKRNNRFREKEKELIELKAKLDSKEDVKFKVDLSLAISVLEVAWSNETDDNKANELRKQIDYIMSLSNN